MDYILHQPGFWLGVLVLALFMFVFYLFFAKIIIAKENKKMAKEIIEDYMYDFFKNSSELNLKESNEVRLTRSVLRNGETGPDVVWIRMRMTQTKLSATVVFLASASFPTKQQARALQKELISRGVRNDLVSTKYPLPESEYKPLH